MFHHLVTPKPTSDTVAAIDLGSNSFHMIVARISGGDLQVVDKLREMVRLGAGLDEHKNLTPEAAARALECLQRFGQRLHALPAGSVRAVGTNTLRQVRDSGQFLKAAESALGHPIEVIGGREEARLVYLGVAYGLTAGDDRRLVVDIGGGSTELIIGEGFSPSFMESMHMGCVSMSRRFFADAVITADRMRSAELTGALEMRPVKNFFRQAGWQLAVGSSGTIRAIRDVTHAAGWADAADGITRDGLQRLSQALVEAGRIDHIQLEGLSVERRPVFAGGVAVLRAVFEALSIEQMQVSDKALREGLLYEMLGRTHQDDVRESTMRALCGRYDVDMEQAGRVEATARALFDQVAEPWGLMDAEYAETLGLAARLHEIGLTVSHAQYHKHGAYLIANSDMAGFSRQQQLVLSALVRCHRRKFSVAIFNDALQDDIVHCAMQLCVLLRLSVLLHRARHGSIEVDPVMSVNGNNMELKFPAGWLVAHPLPQMELEQESKLLKAAGFRLKFS